MTEAAEIIKTGMSTELWGQRFYQEAAARTESEDGKKVFQSLVDEEGRHLDILRGEYAALTKSAEWVSLDEAVAMAESVDPIKLFPDAASAEQLIPGDSTDEQALLMAMDFERRGYTLYAQAAEDAQSDAERVLWEHLAKAEDQHYAYLQETYEYLVNNGVWYHDDLERPFFEG
ncbi:MAG: ferritin-like domain-containing protein [Anaerolineae bacterium]|jgi:rubrerythrin|nr:ferritin family protein [Chloroflexota bacterium]